MTAESYKVANRWAVVIGEALVDIVETPSGRSEVPGGSPANVALGLGRLGNTVDFLTQIGCDARGQLIARHLKDSGVGLLPGSITNSATSSALARIQADGSARYEFDITWGVPPNAVPLQATVLHVGSIAAFLEPGASEVRRYMRAANCEHVTFDPNIRQALLGSHAETVEIFEQTAALATTVKLSDEDASWLYPNQEPSTVLRHVLELGPRLAVATLGAEGSIAMTMEHEVRVEPIRVVVADTIGAGDTYMASLIDSLLNNQTKPLGPEWLQVAATRAARTAALTVSRPGADLPYRRELPDLD